MKISMQDIRTIILREVVFTVEADKGHIGC